MSTFYTSIANYYDAEIGPTDDVDFYLEVAEEHGSPILDVGCGTGRIMIPLAQAGYDVYGIDNNKDMLHLFELKLEQQPELRPNITIWQDDLLTIDISQKFNLILLTYNLLMHFHEQADQIKLLQQLRQWVTEDGILVFDLPNAGEIFGTPDLSSFLMERTFLEPNNGHVVILQSQSTLDRVTQIMQIHWLFDEIEIDGTLRRTYAQQFLRYFFFSELSLLLKLTGFTVDAVYGDMNRNPFEDGCEQMIVFARPV